MKFRLKSFWQSGLLTAVLLLAGFGSAAASTYGSGNYGSNIYNDSTTADQNSSASSSTNSSTSRSSTSTSSQSSNTSVTDSTDSTDTSTDQISTKPEKGDDLVTTSPTDQTPDRKDGFPWVWTAAGAAIAVIALIWFLVARRSGTDSDLQV